MDSDCSEEIKAIILKMSRSKKRGQILLIPFTTKIMLIETELTAGMTKIPAT